MRLSGQVALVTGGGSGIGEAILRAFTREGADLVVADRDIAAAERVSGELQAAGRRALPIEVDVRHEEGVLSMVERALAEFGQIDILVNNAGIAPRQRPLVEQNVDHIDRLLAVHVRGPMLCCKFAGPSMIERQRGAVLNISSVVGLGGMPNRAAYGPAKAAIVNFTQAMAVEWAPYGIRVNAITPGYIRTPYVRASVESGAFSSAVIEQRTPLGRLGEPEEIAEAALFLCSPAASYITGVTLPVDGGFSAFSFR